MNIRDLAQRILSDITRYREIQGTGVEQPWQTVLGCVVLAAVFWLVWCW